MADQKPGTDKETDEIDKGVEKAPGRKRFDPGSVVSGLFFLAVAGVFIAGALAGDPIAGPEIIGPVLLAGLGLVGLVRVLTRSRRH